MKVTIITSFPFPNGKATANRVRTFAEQLIANSNIKYVDIVCCSQENNKTYFFDNNIKVINIKSKKVNKNNYLLRALNELTISIKLWQNAKKTNSEIFLITIPSILLLFPIIFFRKPKLLSLDIRDAVWTYFQDGMLQNVLKILSKSLFKLSARKVDILSVTNSYEAESVKQITKQEPMVVPNGISQSKFYELISIPILKNSLSSKINITYIGNVGIAQELDVLLDFSIKNKANILVRIVGDGAITEKLKKRKDDEMIHNLEFFDPVPQEEVVNFIQDADILFAQIGEKYSSAVPTKIFEYIASGKKTLLGLPNGPAKDIFINFKGTKIFNTGNLDSLQVAFDELVCVDLSEDNIKENLKHLNNNYIREKIVNNFIVNFDSSIKKVFKKTS